jgi:hypothetical protein
MSHSVSSEKKSSSLGRLALCMYAAYVLKELHDDMFDNVSCYFGNNWIELIEHKLKYKKEVVYNRIHRYRTSGLNIQDIGYRLSTKFMH